MKILIEIPSDAEETLKALAFLDGGLLKDLNLEIYLAGLKAKAKGNKQLADILTKHSKSQKS